MHKCLHLNGFEVFPVATGGAALSTVQNQRTDALVTEWRFRDMGGADLIERTRRLFPTTLIVCVSLDNNPLTAVEAYEAGANNHLAKPLVMDVLLAILRGREAVQRREAVVSCGQLRVDNFSQNVTYDGREVAVIDDSDFRIISNLIRSQGNVVQRESLIKAVWGATKLVDPLELDRRIKRIVRAFKEAGATTSLIYLVADMGGYMMSDLPPKLAQGKKKTNSRRGR